MSDWYEQANQVLMPTYDRIPIHFVRGEGPYLYDGDGTRYLDALAGIAVNVLGYRHPRLVDAARRAAGGVQHVSNLFHIEPQFRLAETLSDVDFPASCFFCNSGAEAVEAAIKFARQYSHRQGNGGTTVLSFRNSFHGRTLGALAATGQKKYQKGFEPLPGGFKHVSYNDLSDVRAAIDESVCAILIEVIQGEGGIVPADSEFLRDLRALCDRQGLLLMVDEIQTGIGRTGEFFGYQHFDIKPDVISLAKGLAGGFPMGALMVRRELREGFQPGDHASTFGGNPFVSAMALTTLQTLRDENLVENARLRGTQLKRGLDALAEQYESVRSPRGMGFMLGLPLAEPLEASEVMDEARNHRLLIGTAGGNALRFVPPLILTEENVDSLLGRLESTLQATKG